LTAFQIKERKQRTCFVGNVPLDMSTKQLKSMFAESGKVEAVWCRSVPTQLDSKIPLRAKIIKNQLGAQKDNKNAYVLFEKAEDALKAVGALNQKQVPGGKHIRVDLDARQAKHSTGAEDAVSPAEHDTNTTIFIGNLPFTVNEEDLRRHFADLSRTEGMGHLVGDGDGILNVRVIRDAQTHLGKGIAYIMFTSKPLMRLAIEHKNGYEFMGRELRIKKAVSAIRLEKKKIRKADRGRVKQEEAVMRAEARKEDEQVSKLRGLHNALESDDSDDEREGDKRKPQVALHNKSKTIKKDDSDEFRQHIAKIAAKSEQANKRIQEEGLDITPRVAFNKKKQVKVLKQKIKSGGTSKYED